jgi:hypothetical protein
MTEDRAILSFGLLRDRLFLSRRGRVDRLESLIFSHIEFNTDFRKSPSLLSSDSLRKCKNFVKCETDPQF